MANRRMNLSGQSKETLDLLCEHIECERPLAIKIALAKGISKANGMVTPSIDHSKPKWTIPDSIIREKDYLLFKHLIINEISEQLSEDKINEYMLLYIEYGLNIIKKEMEDLTSLEDYRLAILK